MTDILTAGARSEHMSNIRSKNTSPEILVRRGLHAAGLRFRVHKKDLPGRPDVVLPRHNAVILIHGCFWHRHKGCRLTADPKTRIAFWTDKFRANQDRDQRTVRELKRLGWRILIVWECAIRNKRQSSMSIAAIVRWIHGTTTFSEIPRARRTSPTDSAPPVRANHG
jgi:DNA mismatch endonuclease (patch repair protein)